MYGRRLQQQQQQQNETILLPPCLLGSQSYSNTCKQCNYTGASVTLSVNVTRSGVISQLGQNPLGFAAPGIAVTPGGSIVIVTSYSGPAQHPNSTLPAYPGGTSFEKQLDRVNGYSYWLCRSLLLDSSVDVALHDVHALLTTNAAAALLYSTARTRPLHGCCCHQHDAKLVALRQSHQQ
jgi:hypothetical protein